MHKETKEQKQKKKAYIDSDQSTIDFWVQAIQDLRVYDQIYEEEKYFIKEVNLIDYALRALELMTQVAQYSDVSFIIALINLAEVDQRKNKKILLTSFVSSFAKCMNYSNELSYLTIMLNPKVLPLKTPNMIQFYLKIRKFIYQHFVNERDNIIKPMSFDSWVSVVSKFLDNKAISSIGNRIKDQILKTKNNEKILKNNVLPFDLLIFCYEYYEDKHQQEQQVPQPRQIPTFSPQQYDEPVSQEHQSNQPNARLNSQQIAYKILMPVPNRMQNQNQNQSGTKQKIEPALQDALTKALETHQQLAYQYTLLANYATTAKEVAAKFAQKVRTKQQIDEQDVEQLEQIAKFNQILDKDPNETFKEMDIIKYI
ncbi:hypothetical protein pb186bvf_018092 [Paramecium bursaria]